MQDCPCALLPASCIHQLNRQLRANVIMPSSPWDEDQSEGKKILPVERRAAEPPKAFLSPGITGAPVSLVRRQLTAPAKRQGGGTVTWMSRAQPGEYGLKGRYMASSVSHSSSGHPYLASRCTGSMTHGSMQQGGVIQVCSVLPTHPPSGYGPLGGGRSVLFTLVPTSPSSVPGLWYVLITHSLNQLNRIEGLHQRKKRGRDMFSLKIFEV